ncbi:MauE/DoxX family redox-associated membrane protein [Olivibacter oleidegradans]|uniref:MauE/DoxX family redox-associated membrane protein n=1 Tax=Olivibacter oleidegradans TaxID=760123 RepID=A0ABV6HFK8_9SPHI
MKTQNLFSIILIIVLAISATIKIIHHERTVSDMMMQVFPISWAKYLAWAQPTFQLLLSLALVSHQYNRIGLVACSGYFALLVIYSASVLSGFYQYQPCSCIGLFKGLNWVENLGLHSATFLIAMFGLYHRQATVFLKSIFTKKERRLKKRTA